MRSPRAPLGLLVACLFAVSACTGGLPVGVPGAGNAKKSPRPTDLASGGPARDVGLSAVGRVVSQNGAAVTVRGEVRLISDHGGGLISDHGAAIISNNTGGLISNNGGGLVAKTKYALGQLDRGTAELRLADAEIRIYDAAGKLLTDESGKPLGARSDGQGGYLFSAVLPAENLVLRIRLWNGGELSAILAKAEAKTREVPIDTAATIGAVYVLDRFVKGDQKTFDKLPASEAERLRKELDAARVHLAGAPKYELPALVALADELRKKAPAVDKTFKDIEVLLLGGLGDGKRADRVALNRPRALAIGPGGVLYIGEHDFGRIRTVAPDGTLATLVDGGGGTIKANYPGILDLDVRPDGTIYLVSENLGQVVRLAPSGEATVVAGGGRDEGDLAGKPAGSLALQASAVAVAPDGTLYVGEANSQNRLFAVGTDGKAVKIALPADWPPGPRVSALAVSGDGTLFVLINDENDDGSLWRRTPAGAWTRLLDDLTVGTGDVVLAADGTLYLLEENGPRISRIATDGAVTVLVGANGPKDTPAFVSPTNLAIGPDGTLFVADRRTNLVHARSPEGVWRLAAGAVTGTQNGQGDLTFNGPTGVAFDAKGHMIVSEGTGNSVKRWDGKAATTIAGGVKGFAGDGGQATAARFDIPSAVAVRDDEVLVLDSRNFSIRAIDGAGVVRTLVGNRDVPEAALQPGVQVDTRAYSIKGGAGLAVAPDGTLYWSSTGIHQVARQLPDGKVELVAGRPLSAEDRSDDRGDGGAPTAAGLTAPLGLAFDPLAATPTLYICDTGNLRIRKVTGIGTPQAKIEAFAGRPRDESLLELLALAPGWERKDEGKPATEAVFAGPAAACFDKAGTMYVAEVGLANITQLSTNREQFEKLGMDTGAFKNVPARIRKITRDGRVSTLIGPGGKLFTDPDGPDALIMPMALAIDPQGRLVIVDVRTNTIRIVPAEALN